MCSIRVGVYGVKGRGIELKPRAGWWWCYPILSEGWGRGGTPRRPNSRATTQGLYQRLKMEVVPKMARRRGSDAGQSRRR